MAIFKSQNGMLKMLKLKQISKEKELQSVVEKNLLEIFDMYFLATEYSTTFGGRIDTLAVDSAGCPVIIEYKRNKNDNVINQSLSYLKWLQLQKQEFFEMLIQKTLPKEIYSNIKIDWKNTRVICIAEAYSKFDIDTVEVVPIRIELYKYKFYEDDIIDIESVNIIDTKDEKITHNSIKKQSDDYMKLLSKGNKDIQDMFLTLRSKILELDEAIEERVTSLYIAYRLSKSFAEIHIGSKQISVFMRPIDYVNPEIEVEKISDGYNWTLNKRIYIKSIDDIEPSIRIIEQSYDDVR